MTCPICHDFVRLSVPPTDDGTVLSCPHCGPVIIGPIDPIDKAIEQALIDELRVCLKMQGK